MFHCLVLRGKNQKQCPILMGLRLGPPWCVNGSIAVMWQSQLLTWKNMFPLHTPSHRRLFSQIPVKKVIVKNVEWLSWWITILQCTCTTTTTLALNVTIAMNIFLARKVASLRSTWSCAPPPVMVTLNALVNGDACLLSFRLWLCNCTLTCYSVATLQAFIPWKIRYGWWNK